MPLSTQEYNWVSENQRPVGYGREKGEGIIIRVNPMADYHGSVKILLVAKYITTHKFV